MYLIIFITSFFSILTVEAHAYLDPGTGSIILQALIGFIAAAGTAVSLYWQKLKLFFKKFSKKKGE
jgi:hypothetical protein